jgi:hypothetical protein
MKMGLWAALLWAALEPIGSAEASRTGPLRKPNYTIGGLIVVDGSRRRAYAVFQIWSNQCGDTFSSVFGPELKRVLREGAIFHYTLVFGFTRLAWRR